MKRKEFVKFGIFRGLIYKVGIRKWNGFRGFVQIVKRDVKRCFFYVQLVLFFNVNICLMLKVKNDTL